MGVTFTNIGLVAATIMAAVVARLIADDIKAWLPTLIEYLIDRAVQRSPEEYRQRLGEEWQSFIADIPGDLSKLVAAVGLLKASRHVRQRDALRYRWLRAAVGTLAGVYVEGVVAAFRITARILLRCRGIRLPSDLDAQTVIRGLEAFVRDVVPTERGRLRLRTASTGRTDKIPLLVGIGLSHSLSFATKLRAWGNSPNSKS